MILLKILKSENLYNSEHTCAYGNLIYLFLEVSNFNFLWNDTKP